MIKLKNRLGPFEFDTNILISFEEVRMFVSHHLSSSIPLYGIDIETAKHPKFLHHPQAGLDPILTRPRLIQIYDGEQTYVVDLFKIEGAFKEMKKLITAKTFVAHNAKFELKHFMYHGVPFADIHCSYLVSSLVHKAENEQYSKEPEIPGDEVYDEDWDGMSRYRFVGHSLDACIGRHYKVKISKHLQVSDWNALDLSKEQLLYAGLDALLTYRLFCDLWPGIERNDIGKSYQLTKDLQYPVAEMEIEGFPVDWEAHARLCEEWEKDKKALEPAIKRWFGECNLNSTKQKGEWLQWYLPAIGEKQLLDQWPLTGSGKLSFSKGTLVEYSHFEPINLLLQYSKVAKLISTYGEGLTTHRHPVTNCLHTGFKLAHTQTGRLASAQPNLQNMPRDNKDDPPEKQMRRIFKAPPGYKLVVGDLSQIEMRVAAALSNDPTLTYCFTHGIDTHRLVVNSVFGTPIEKVTKKERQFGKAINFGLMFGMGANKLIKYAKMNYGVDLDLSLAYQGINAFKTLYAGLVLWSDTQRALAEATGYTSTTLGERRKLGPTELYTIPVNHPIQGGAGEVMKWAMYRGWAELRKRGMKSVMVSTVHDEMSILSPDEEAQEAVKVLEDCNIAAMRHLFPGAPLEGLIEAGIGETWATAKP
jgi:DNA polymerase-1